MLLRTVFVVLFFFTSPFWASSLVAQPKTSVLKFIPNKGQWNTKVNFQADLPGGKLFAEKNALTYSFYDADFLAAMHNHSGDVHTSQEDRSALFGFHSYKMIPLGSNENPTIIPSVFSEELYNYYLGNDPEHWASGLKASGELLYKNLYNNIDFRLYGANQSLKYEFIVYPGGNVKTIQLQYKGLKNISIQRELLVLETSVNTITEQAPYVFQTINGKTQEIKCRFKLKDSLVTFELLQSYNKNYPLVIDPQLIFSTYSGSTADNWGNTAAFDVAGNMYSGGTVFGVGYPTTLGAYQVNYAGINFYGYGIDVGILKFNSTGTALLYATYLGGVLTEVPYSLVVDSNDDLVIMGTTGSANFPTTLGAYDRTFNGGTFTIPDNGIIFNNGSDIFVSKLNSNGTSLLGSSYIGGNLNDGIQLSLEALTQNYGDQLRGDVITDNLNEIYVACNTKSTNFPTTAGALQSLIGGGKDACAFKLNSSLTSLIWSTYLGGTGEDAAYSIQVDSTFNVYISGGTNSTNFPVTTGVYQTSNLGAVDGFVSHISSNGQLLLHSTFVGTTAYDQSYFVQLDESQNVYLLGQTKGNYPVTSGVYSNPSAGQFIHGFTPELDSTLFSTVVGSGGNQPNISPTAFLVNECGNVFLSGWGGALNAPTQNLTFYGYVGGSTLGMPVTADAYRGVSDGSDFYIMVLSNYCKNLLYATYFGMNDPNSPDHVDGGTSRFDKKGIIYEAVCGGCGNNDNFPTTPGAWSRTNNSFNCNNAAFKLDLTNLEARFNHSPVDSCGKVSLTFSNTSAGGKSFFWDFGDGTTSNSATPPLHSYTVPGYYTITLIVTDQTTCIGKDTATTTIYVPPIPPITFSLVDTVICEGKTLQLNATLNPTYTYDWTPGESLSDSTIANPIAFPTKTTRYHITVIDTNQCKVEKDVTVNVNPLPTIEAGPDKVVCPGISTELSVSGNGIFKWESSPYLSCVFCRNPKITPPIASDDFYSVEITDINGCKKLDSVRIQSRPLPAISVSFDWSGRCYTDNFKFKPSVTFSDYTCPVSGKYQWSFGDGSSSTENNPKHYYFSGGNYLVSFQYGYSNVYTDTIVVFEKDSCVKNIFVPNTFTPNSDGVNDKVYVRTINATKILFRIFNRWGEEVFQTESLNEGWDGTYKGIKQTPQTFVYTADVTFWDNERKIIEGNITLVK